LMRLGSVGRGPRRTRACKVTARGERALGVFGCILHEPILAEGQKGPPRRRRGLSRSKPEKGDVLPDTILVTGAAGFIGMHVARRLLADGHTVVGLDNLNPYYDPRLKQARVAELQAFPNFRFEKLDLADRAAMAALFAAHPFPLVVNLAAQAGGGPSLIDP